MDNNKGCISQGISRIRLLQAIISCLPWWQNHRKCHHGCVKTLEMLGTRQLSSSFPHLIFRIAWCIFCFAFFGNFQRNFLFQQNSKKAAPAASWTSPSKNWAMALSRSGAKPPWVPRSLANDVLLLLLEKIQGSPAILKAKFHTINRLLGSCLCKKDSCNTTC